MINHNPNKLKEKNVEARLKVWLLKGKTITHLQAEKVFQTNRISEYVRRLRNKGMDIKTEMVIKDGSLFGRYYMDFPKKKSRIKSKAYLNVGAG